MLKQIKTFTKQNLGSVILPHLPWQFCDFGFSGRIIIEPTNYCNLRCPLCPTSTAKRTKGFLAFDDFKKIIDDISGLKSINFGWSGEPLLNKEIFKMVKYASVKGIKTGISTNTTFLNRYIDEALNSGLDTIIVCLDGASKETHEKYRIGSDFELIKNNIKEFCAEKKKRGLAKPHIVLQSLLTKFNEHETSAIMEMARNLGVDSLEFKTLSLGSSIALAEKIKRAKEFLPSAEFSRYDLNGGVPLLKSSPKLCSWLRQSVILWNGDVTTCCYDFEGKMKIGNVFDDGGFDKIWKSEKYKKYRKGILKKEFALCKNCSRTGEYTQRVEFYKNK
jgi:radical SAM protein with 4Fe4S-binding SPASM domain